MIYTSKKQLRNSSHYNYKDLTQAQLQAIKEHSDDIKQIACYCKYGYTVGSLWFTNIGLVYCDSYGEYCKIQDLK